MGKCLISLKKPKTTVNMSQFVKKSKSAQPLSLF